MATDGKRHPSTEHMLKLSEANPRLADLPDKTVYFIAQQFDAMAHTMVDTLKDSPELTAGLRKLWEAKNSFVAAAVHFNNGNAVEYRDR